MKAAGIQACAGHHLYSIGQQSGREMENEDTLSTTEASKLTTATTTKEKPTDITNCFKPRIFALLSLLLAASKLKVEWTVRGIAMQHV